MLDYLTILWYTVPLHTWTSCKHHKHNDATGNCQLQPASNLRQSLAGLLCLPLPCIYPCSTLIKPSLAPPFSSTVLKHGQYGSHNAHCQFLDCQLPTNTCHLSSMLQFAWPSLGRSRNMSIWLTPIEKLLVTPDTSVLDLIGIWVYYLFYWCGGMGGCWEQSTEEWSQEQWAGVVDIILLQSMLTDKYCLSVMINVIVTVMSCIM